MDARVSLLEKRVEDSMTSELVTVKFSTPIFEIVKKMADRSVSGIIVTDNVGEILGIISSLDVFKIFGERSLDEIERLVAEDIMTPFTVEIRLDDTLEDAAIMMLENKIHRLIVVGDAPKRKPIGILSSTDIVREISARLN